MIRFTDKNIGLVRIDTTTDTKPARTIIEQLIAVADDRIAVGRSRTGGVVLVFRTDKPRMTVPHVAGADHGQTVFKLAALDGSIRLTIGCDCDGARFDPSAYKFGDVVQEQLPVLTVANLGTALLAAAFGPAGLTWAALVEYERARTEREERARAEFIKQRDAETPEQRQLREEQQLADSEPYFTSSERFGFVSPNSAAVLAARGRIAIRAEAKLKADGIAAETARKSGFRARLAALEAAFVRRA